MVIVSGIVVVVVVGCFGRLVPRLVDYLLGLLRRLLVPLLRLNRLLVVVVRMVCLDCYCGYCYSSIVGLVVVVGFSSSAKVNK